MKGFSLQIIKNSELIMCILNASPLADSNLKSKLEARISWLVNSQAPQSNFNINNQVLKIVNYNDEIRNAAVECFIEYENERIQNSIVL